MTRSDIDWVLIRVLDGIAQNKIGMTVFSGGLAISGTVVDEDVYFRALGLNSIADRVAKSVKERFAELEDLNEQLARDDLSGEERQVLMARVSDLDPAFIMMVDVTIFGAGPTPLTAPTWRGRLSQVSGWTFGTYGSVGDAAQETVGRGSSLG